MGNSKLSLALKLTVASAAITAVFSALGVASYLRALHEAQGIPFHAVVEWSGFFVPFTLVAALLALSAIGFLGVLLAPIHRARILGLLFTSGAVIVLCSRWVAVAFGVLHFPGIIGIGFSMLAVAWFIGLAFALWPNNSFKRTREKPRAA